MNIIAIDTATEGCSAALLVGSKLLSRMTVEPRKHAELILPMLDDLLAEAGLSINQLDAIAFGRGPGAFTGVRIATGVVQGIAFGADLPVVPVSTLRALAQRAYDEHGETHVLSAFDARMDEIYWGAYQLDQAGLMSLIDEEQVIEPADVACPDVSFSMDWAGAGSGWQVYQAILEKSLDCKVKTRYPSLITRAEEIVKLAAADFKRQLYVSADQALPVYLRNQVAWKKSV